MPVLKHGDRGKSVTLLQQLLSENNVLDGAASGRFDDETLRAVMLFQDRKNLSRDGVAGLETLGSLVALRPTPASIVSTVTPAKAAKMFPERSVAGNIARNLPFVLQALEEAGLGYKDMVLMALATIRAETAGFRPISEGKSKFNTSAFGTANEGPAFDLYDDRGDLGNRGHPDGASYRGRGYVQLTGRSNYRSIGAALGMGSDLETQPELANDPATAGRILAAFLKTREHKIRAALLFDDLPAARRLVNGGSHGLDRFTKAYKAGAKAL